MSIPLASTSRRTLGYLGSCEGIYTSAGRLLCPPSPIPRHAGPSRLRQGIRRSSSSSTPSPLPDDIVRPLKRSPYRLLPLPTFLSSFAPLHVAGWRLVNLSTEQTDGRLDIQRLEKGIGTLEGKKMVRAYSFPKEGYGEAMVLVQSIGQAVQEENHHPIVTVCSASDYTNTSSLPISDDKSEHIVEIVTHTHTPLPEIKAAPGDDRKPGPGVTGKDLKLAERIERAWNDAQSAMQA